MKLLLLFLFICSARAKDIPKDEEKGTSVGCETIECQNGGLCTSDGKDGHWCTCPQGFTGVYCEMEDNYVEEKAEDPCDRKPCKNDGLCGSINNSFYKCLCREGYSGKYCETVDDPCVLKPCQNEGKCFLEKGEYKCNCREGFSGANCEIEECRCVNGFCIKENGELKCVCNSGFGLYDKYTCTACNCGKGANCTFEKGIIFDDVICICPQGYEVKGEKCIVISSSTTATTFLRTSDHSTWNPHSTEDRYFSRFPLSTLNRYSTEDRHFSRFPLSTFNPHSTEDRYFSRFPLSTLNRYSTEDRSFSRFPLSTPNRYGSSDQHFFSTHEGFSGSPYRTTSDFRTTLDCRCQNGLCVIDIYGNTNCVCNPQYAKNGYGMCTPCNCGQGANCEFIKDWKHCFCPPGYEDSHGSCTDVNECRYPRACPENTECFNTEGSYDCLCREGYRPSNRSSVVKYEGCIEICNSNACVNGHCNIDGYSYFCKCDHGFAGRRCEEKMDPVNENRIMDIIEIQSPWIILSALFLIIFLAFIVMHRNKTVKKNTFIFSSPDDKCPLFEDPKFVNRLQTEILE